MLEIKNAAVVVLIFLKCNGPNLIMTIAIKKRIRILKGMFEQNRRKNVTLYVAGKIF